MRTDVQQASISDSPVRPATTSYAIGREKLFGHLAMVGFALIVAISFSLGSRAAPHIGPVALNAIRFAIGVAIMAVAVFIGAANAGDCPQSKSAEATSVEAHHNAEDKADVEA